MGLYHVIALGDDRQGFERVGSVKHLAVFIGANMQGIGSNVKHHIALLDGPVHSGSFKPDLQGLSWG